LLVAWFAQLDGEAGRSGGATTVPTDTTVVRSGVASTISGNVATSIQAANNSQPTAPRPQPVSITSIQNNLQLSTVANQAAVPTATTTGVTIQSVQGVGLLLTQSAGNISVSNAFTGTVVNGQFVAPPQPSVLPNGLSFPLATGTNAFSTGQVSGQSFLASDNSVYVAGVDVAGGFAATNGLTALVLGGTPIVTLPTAGVGTYNGIAFGGVANSGAAYTASGGFSATYNFASQTGNMNFSNFDGKNFSGSITAPSSGVYAASLSGSGVFGAAAGQFYGTGASSTAGFFSIANPAATYSAFGVYGGGH
jgi:hypothetical protein